MALTGEKQVGVPDYLNIAYCELGFHLLEVSYNHVVYISKSKRALYKIFERDTF